MIYLASPYSHTRPEMREARFREICKVAARFMEGGEQVFCPIAHSHPIEQHGMAKIQSGDWWLNQDFAILKHCSALYVCMMPGWGKSYGVKQEVQFANDHKIPVFYLDHPHPTEEEVPLVVRPTYVDQGTNH